MSNEQHKDGSRGAEPVTRAELERALRFVHMVEANTRARMAELAATVNAVSETMIAEGQLSLEKLTDRRRLTVLREDERASKTGPRIDVSGIEDKYALQDTPKIDCDSRLPLCKARCCCYTVMLSVQDLDEGLLRWDYGQPYQLARREDGYCTYNDVGSHCSVYEARPAACRVYDCRNDRRIWLDFEARIPAP